MGTLYRNGPGKNEVGGKPYAHLFDGDGLLSQFAFDGKRLHYRNRFVRTTHYLAERAADKPVMRNYGQQRPGGPLGNAFRMPANVANTSVQYHAGKLLALYEGGRPWELDPDSLETLGEYDYDGELKGSFTYSAHPTWDPATARALQLRDPVRPAHEAAHVPRRHAREAAPSARDQPALRDDQSRLCADVRSTWCS